MTIYEALMKDHKEVKALLAELVGLSDDEAERRHDLIAQIRDGLIPHSRAEEAVFYNSMRLLDASKGLAAHAYMEHMEAEGLLRTLQLMDKLETGWRPLAKKLQTALEHHIEEEEGEIFSAARQLFTQEEAVAMAETFEAMKPDIKDEGLTATTLDMVVNLMPPRFSDKFRKANLIQP